MNDLDRHERCMKTRFTIEQRVELLKMLLKRHGSIRKLANVLSVSKSSVDRYLKGYSGKMDAIIDYRICMVIDEDEIRAVINKEQILKRAGILREDNTVDLATLLAIIDSALEYPQIKDIILKEIAKKYKSELQKLVSQELPKIELCWDRDFEKWLTERKSRPISERTLRDYKNIWHLCLQGKTLGWHLLKQLEGTKMLCRDGRYHPTGWVRQVFRHYIRYLYSIGKLDWDTYTRLLMIAPGRRYGHRVVQKAIMEEDVIGSLKKLRDAGRVDIYMLYLLMLYSAIRFEHTLNVLKNWKPDEVVYVSYLNRNIKRLECLETHCRYYVGKEREHKPVGLMFFPRYLLESIEEYKGKLPSKRRIEKAVKRLDCLPPKYIRIYAVRLILQVLGDNDVSKFILSKFGELSVSARHYRDLLEEADKVYPKYIKYLEMREIIP